ERLAQERRRLDEREPGLERKPHLVLGLERPLDRVDLIAHRLRHALDPRQITLAQEIEEAIGGNVELAFEKSRIRRDERALDRADDVRDPQGGKLAARGA